MTKNMRIMLIIICFVLLFFLIGVLIWGIVERDFSFNKHLEIVKEELFSMSEIDKVQMVTRSSDIKVYRTEGEQIRIVQKSSSNKKESKLFTATAEKGILSIDGKNSDTNFCIGFCFFRDSVYEVYLPKDYSKTVIIETTSGDITLEELGMEYFQELNILTTSGDIDLKSNIEAESITLKSTSGDIKVTTIKGSTLTFTSTSGDIESESIEGEHISLKTISGDIENHRVSGAVQISTVSGDVEVNHFYITGTSQINSTSGDIDVLMAQDASCKMSADTVSGDISFPHSVSVIGEGTYSLNFKTTSGDIKVKVTN